jgi:hypothetical protein
VVSVEEEVRVRVVAIEDVGEEEVRVVAIEDVGEEVARVVAIDSIPILEVLAQALAVALPMVGVLERFVLELVSGSM